ncbi:MAG: iduronate 2-sulfatase [Verrucomicrobiales bacterium]|jgi:iduronate 2-sulfatase
MTSSAKISASLRLCVSLFLCLSAAVSAEKPNILFIAIDDLRPELGCYGSTAVKSPNLDALAARGLRFDRAYCQEAICAPSRASLLTGTRPDTNKLTHNYIDFSEVDKSLTTLPKHFANNGYESVFCGKIFHRSNQSKDSWTRNPARKLLKLPKPKSYALPANQKLRNDNFKKMFEKYGEAAKKGLGSGPAYEMADVPDHTYIDGYNTELAIATLKQMTSDKVDKPIFLAMGYKLPHLNWIAPKKYWDMYDRDKIELAKQTAGPKGGAAMGLHASFELRTRAGIPKYGPLGEDLSRTLLHAYYASVSYVDAQIGKLVATLKEAGIDDNTIIIVWGDHGWHLGEMGIWGKATNYEIATRVPLMIHSPKMKAKGQGTKALVELLDIYPTLCELAGIPKPDHIEGRSFAPLMDDPDLEWKKAAVSQFPNPALREWAANPLSPGMRETFFGPLIEDVESRIIKQQGKVWDRDLFEKNLTGYTLRSERYRLVAWRDHRDAKAEPIFYELFDHQNDPTETVNVAAENFEVVAELNEQLEAILTQKSK